MAQIKNKTLKEILLAIVGIAIILGIAFIAFVMLKEMWHMLLSIDKEISATIIATSGTILVAVGTLIYNQRRTKQREIAEAHRNKKVEVYDEFMQMIVNVLRHAKEKEDKPELPDLPKNIEDFFFKFTRESIVWASPEIVQGWNNFRIAARDGGGNILLLVDDILREIRKDLGNSNKGLKRGDLISLFLTDPETLDQIIRQKT